MSDPNASGTLTRLQWCAFGIADSRGAQRNVNVIDRTEALVMDSSISIMMVSS
ncbi:hypothetical protein [Duncaniella dubosii]|uniref:hypothetical protein n=1 Tax=Duncaniella dubosii TaxID=2518971 RepID=UPI003F67E96B